MEIKSETKGITTRHWTPLSNVNECIKYYCQNKNHKNILEIGPGIIPFELSTNFIGCNEKIKNYVNIDIDKETFPYVINQFDFVYCRHVLEDIQNPDFAMNEILRISKSGGYIETPSPLIEITKNVDSSSFASMYCGYIHHRYIVWSSIEKNEIYFLPKYSCILDHVLNFKNNDTYDLINNNPIYWNNYFLFETPPKIIMYKNGVNFHTSGSVSTMVDEYISLLNRAVNESIENTNYFLSNYINVYTS